SLFIAGLTFHGPRLDEAKMGILVASLLSGALGAGLLTAAGRRISAQQVEHDAQSISPR
ncbi:MAG: Na+/H+ antiporter NhaA, partial [Actinomycetota bacterium]|nr:Na+/H+ antiporter NhaA [Actinomycetota bacterium]